MVISKASAEHYQWGEECDGWHLVKRPALSVIQEQVPVGRGEQRHYHSAIITAWPSSFSLFCLATRYWRWRALNIDSRPIKGYMSRRVKFIACVMVVSRYWNFW